MRRPGSKSRSKPGRRKVCRTGALGSFNSGLSFMRILRCAIIAAPLWAMSIDAGTAAGRDEHDPLRFFEGKTESVSTVKVLFKRSYETRAIGTGRIENGRLELV